MKVSKTANSKFKINEKKIVKLTDMGNIKEIMYLEKRCNTPFGIKKISKDQYLVLSTGEIKDFEKIKNRSQDIESLRKSFKNLIQLINTNFTGGLNELIFTITYKENVRDTKKLYDDFRKFMKKLKYKYKKVEYINVVEPQGRGAWHCHVLLKFPDVRKIYIPNKEIAEMWGQGFVKVKAIRKDIDNIGAYLSAYLGDVEFNEENLTELVYDGVLKPGQAIETKTAVVNGVEKRFIKGGRLHFYPSGMNIYRTSRGIKKPEVTYMMYENARKKVGSNLEPTYTSHTFIQDDTGNIVNEIAYEQYNIKKVQNQ